MTDADISNVDYGDRKMAHANEILRSTVGSGLHGIAIAGTDDHDEMGIYIEPPEAVLGLSTWDYKNNVPTCAEGSNYSGLPHYTSRTKPEGAGDTDLVIYSLRKYLRLATKGNPTALLPLYAPEESLLLSSQLGDELRENRNWFLSQEAIERFLGYMQAQHERMMGFGKRNRVPSRPELIEKFGWDVKYGSHALRLAYQGYEIAQHGRLTLPLMSAARERVLAVKRGEISQLEVSAEIKEIEQTIRFLLDNRRTAVPPRPDRASIDAWSISAHRRHWGW